MKTSATKAINIALNPISSGGGSVINGATPSSFTSISMHYCPKYLVMNPLPCSFYKQ